MLSAFYQYSKYYPKHAAIVNSATRTFSEHFVNENRIFPGFCKEIVKPFLWALTFLFFPVMMKIQARTC